MARIRKPPKERKRPSQNPILEASAKRATKSPAYRASPKLEKQMAKRTGGYRTAGSGNKREKGDVRVRGVTRIEHKATQKKSFSVTREMLEKIENAGRGCEEIPVLVVDFLDERGKSKGFEIACLPLQDLVDLIHGFTQEPDS